MPCSSQGLPDAPGRPAAPAGMGGTGQHETSVGDYARESAQRHEERLEAEYQRREAERLRQEAERRSADESRQQEFVRERDAAVSELKGGASAPFGIKGNPEGDLQLKRTTRRAEKPALRTAWAKLQCAGSLSIDAIRAASQDIIDMEKVRLLGQEAMKALNGESIELDCLVEPMSVPPNVDGKEYPDVSLQRKFFVDMVAEVMRQTGRIVEIRREASLLATQRATAKDEVQQLGNKRDVDPEMLRRAEETVRGIDLKIERLRQQERNARSALARQEKRVKDILVKPAAVFPSTRATH